MLMTVRKGPLLETLRREKGKLSVYKLEEKYSQQNIF